MTILKRCHILIALSSVLLFFGCDRPDPGREFSVLMGIYLGQIEEGEPVINGNIIYNPELLLELYSPERELIVAKWDNWENIDQLLNSIRNSYHHGLRPEDYHLSIIYDRINTLSNSGKAGASDSAAFELLLTDSFILLGVHLAAGKIDPLSSSPRWSAGYADINIDWKEFLEKSLAGQQVATNLELLAPGTDNYTGLIEALARHRRIERAGGWRLFLPQTPVLETGIKHNDIALLRERLFREDDNSANDTSDMELFDEELRESVILFQKSAGLKADGVVDRKTVDAMNVSVYDRISVIKANLDRMRRLGDPGDHYIAVNIPAYELTYVKGGKIILTTPVIVGSPERQTPVLSSKITRIELNPFWFIPPGMLRRTILPAVKRDVSYLERRNIEVLDKSWTRVDPDSINWHAGFVDEFPFILRQRPGPDNEMGRIKFQFPNKSFVTLHGTPYHHLFQRTERALSNGCIRIRSPIQLAAYVFDGQDDLTIADLVEIIDREKFARMDIENHVSIHINYFTAWFGEDDITHFRHDIYHLDQPLISALDQSPPYIEQPLRIELPTGMATISGSGAEKSK